MAPCPCGKRLTDGTSPRTDHGKLICFECFKARYFDLVAWARRAIEAAVEYEATHDSQGRPYDAEHYDLEAVCASIPPWYMPPLERAA